MAWLTRLEARKDRSLVLHEIGGWGTCKINFRN